MHNSGERSPQTEHVEKWLNKNLSEDYVLYINFTYFLQHKYHLILLTCTQGGKIINLRYHYFMHCKNSI